MAWIFGIGIGLFLLLSFPKQMGAVILFLIAAAAGLFGFITLQEQQRAEEYQTKVASIGLSASFDAVRCSEQFPILIGIRNGYTQTMQSLSFELAGYREGFSSPVYIGRSLKSDRIIPPGETFEGCWSIPSLDYGAQAGPPQAMIWLATYGYASFGEGP